CAPRSEVDCGSLKGPTGAADHKNCRSAARGAALRGRNPMTKKLVLVLAACLDRKSTRLNSSHGSISYAVFCLKKKKKNNEKTIDKTRDENDQKKLLKATDKGLTVTDTKIDRLVERVQLHIINDYIVAEAFSGI